MSLANAAALSPRARRDLLAPCAGSPGKILPPLVRFATLLPKRHDESRAMF